MRRDLPPPTVAFLEGGPSFLSINRFERKKNLTLALTALRELLDQQPHAKASGRAFFLFLVHT